MSIVMGTWTSEGATLVADTAVFQGYLYGPQSGSKIVQVAEACAIGVVGPHFPLNRLQQRARYYGKTIADGGAFSLAHAWRTDLAKMSFGVTGPDGVWRVEGFSAIMATAHDVYLIGPSFDCVPYGEVPVAIGCGGELALGAYVALRGVPAVTTELTHETLVVSAVSVAMHASIGVDGMIETWRPNRGVKRYPRETWHLYDCAREAVNG